MLHRKNHLQCISNENELSTFLFSTELNPFACVPFLYQFDYLLFLGEADNKKLKCAGPNRDRFATSPNCTYIIYMKEWLFNLITVTIETR